MPYKHITQKEARRMKLVCEQLQAAKIGQHIGPEVLSFVNLSEDAKATFRTAARMHSGILIARFNGGDTLRIIAATKL